MFVMAVTYTSAMNIRLHRFSTFQGGVTLIELMTAISILAILAAIAVPSFQSVVASTRLSGAVSELTASFARARVESIRLGTRVTVCRSNAANTQCSNTAGGGWETGWLIVQDIQRPTVNASVDAGDSITFVGQSLPAEIRILGNSYLANYISFSANGQSKAMLGGISPGRIRVCSTSSALQDSARARDLVINSAGRIVIEKPTVASSCPVPTAIPT